MHCLLTFLITIFILILIILIPILLLLITFYCHPVNILPKRLYLMIKDLFSCERIKWPKVKNAVSVLGGQANKYMFNKSIVLLHKYNNAVMI